MTLVEYNYIKFVAYPLTSIPGGHEEYGTFLKISIGLKATTDKAVQVARGKGYGHNRNHVC